MVSKSSEFHSIEFRQKARCPPKDGTSYPELHRLIAPHLESFNALQFVNDGAGLLELAVSDIEPVSMADSAGNILEFSIEAVSILHPCTSSSEVEKRLFPAEVRDLCII
jgi:DNA-directed RNA polymerase I subunit RPA2